MDEIIEMLKSFAILGIVLFLSSAFSTVFLAFISSDIEKIRKHILKEKKWE